MEDETTFNRAAEAAPQILPESNVLGEILVELGSPDRMALLDRLEILDAPVERTFSVLTELANRILGVPVSLISLVTPERQFFVSSCGLNEPHCSERETDLSHSFCQHVVKRNEPLVISDARVHELVMENLAVRELNVIAYLGVPIVFHDGTVLGSFCSIDGAKRDWTDANLKTLTELASVVAGELETRKKALKETEELEQRLRQAQKMEAIGNFTSGIAHDFNHALGVIQVNADLLDRKNGLTPETQKHVDQIQGAIDSAKDIVGQLLTWSRPDSSEIELVSLASVVEDSIPILASLLPSNVSLEFRNESEQCNVLANRGQLKQVLMNLVGNSKDAMQDTGGPIKVILRKGVGIPDSVHSAGFDTKEFVILQVADQGCGMPKEILHKIHDPYFTTKPIGKGTGLGLWNVQGIVKSHGATMQVASEVAQGTQVSITFPCSDAQRKDALSEKAIETDRVISQEPAGSDSNSAIRVMVVDDEPMLLEGMAEELEFCGYKVHRFLDGEKALEFFKENSTAIDLLITDQVMPHIAGSKLVQKIRAINSEVKAIICSGIVDEIKFDANHGQPADFYLRKPFRLNELREAVWLVAGRAPQRDSN